MTSSDGFVPNPDAAELAAADRQIAEMTQYPDLTIAEGLAAVRATDFSPDGGHGFDDMGPDTGRAVVERVSSWVNARPAARPTPTHRSTPS
jgi:hypothetical protein